jgi:competence protein ComEC
VASLLIALFLFGRRNPILTIALFSVMVGALIFSIHTATLHHSVVNTFAGKSSEVVIQAVVTSEPKQKPDRVRGSHFQKGKISFLARTTTLHVGDDHYRVRVPIRILSNTTIELIPGDKILATGFLIKTAEKRVAATLIDSDKISKNADAYPALKLLAEVRADYRNRLSRFGDNAGALIPGMIIGDTSLQSSEFSDQMRKAGLSHLTAVSGANFAIVSSLVFILCRRIIPTILPRLIVTSGFLILFLLLVRPSPSVLRAGVMAAVVLAARASGNSQNSVAALATAISVLLLVDPFQALDPGFILSVLATSGLLFIAPYLTSCLVRFLPESLAEMIAVPCAATIACTPYLLALSGEISALSVFFNVLVAPVVAPITILGFLALLVMPLEALHSLLVWPAHLFASWITRVASWAEASPAIGVHPWALLSFFVLGYFILIRFRLRSPMLIVFFVIALIFIPRMTFPGSNWKVLQCDVGQGDALLVNLGRGEAILFDAGPDSRALQNCLRRVGIKKLPLLIISHGHADHYFGAQSLSSHFEIGDIWSNGNTQVSSTLNREIQSIRQGMKASLAGITIEILWPNDVNQEFESLGGDGSTENNRSVVALVDLNGAEILVTGDIEPEVQARLAEEFDLSRVSILKVPHHGSRFQSDEFLKEISPEIALVSVGNGNSYGHPNLELLASLRDYGAEVFRTDKDGPIAVAWRFDDRAARYIFTTRAMRREWWPVQWR